MNRKLSAVVIVTTCILVAAAASAHISTASGPALAGGASEVTLQVAHGCAMTGTKTTTDTTSVTVEIPAGVTGVRAVSSTDFATVTETKDGSGNVTSITWTKEPGAVLDSDSNFYKLTLRATMPTAPFSKIYFKAHQACKAPGKAVDWVGLPTEDAGDEAAPVVVLLPAHVAGWNKVTLTAAVTDMSVFKDAQIVWKGTAAYSANTVVADQIKVEPGVTALTALAVGDEIYVKY